MFKELAFETMRNTYLEMFSRDKKQFLMIRLVLMALGLMVGIALWVAIGHPAMFLGVLVLGILGFKLPYLQLLMQKSNADVVKTFIFPQFLRYFIALYSTQGNVYQTLEETAKYMDEPIRSRLEKFIDQIGEENSYDYYVDFADYIGTPDAYLVMSMIYSFSENGAVKEELEELENSSRQISENKMKEMVRYKASEQEKYMNHEVILSIMFLLGFVGSVAYSMLSNIMNGANF